MMASGIKIFFMVMAYFTTRIHKNYYILSTTKIFQKYVATGQNIKARLIAIVKLEKVNYIYLMAKYFKEILNKMI